MNKKVIAAVLAGSMCTALLAGCGSSQTDSAQTTSTEASAEASTEAADAQTTDGSGSANLVMAWWGNQVRNERTQQALDKYHELNPDVTVEGQFNQGNGCGGRFSSGCHPDGLFLH